MSNKKIDNIPPIVTLTQKEVTSNSITIEASAIDNESGMPEKPEFEFYIKEESEENYSTKPVQILNGMKTTFTETNLKSDVEYEIMVKVKDKQGNIGVSTAKIKTAKQKTYIIKEGSNSINMRIWNSNCCWKYVRNI